MKKRTLVAIVTPNITTGLWARAIAKNVVPAVDRCVFALGHPDKEFEEWGLDVLAPLKSDTTICRKTVGEEWKGCYCDHGSMLTDLMSLPELAEDEVLVMEDDTFVLCDHEDIEEYFDRLHVVGGVIGSRMCFGLEAREERFFDTFGDGLYPNMMFAWMPVLRRWTDMNFRASGDDNGGDVGHNIGRQLHRNKVHIIRDAHLPQNRLSQYPGCDPVDLDGALPRWVHVGQMSGPPRWKEQKDIVTGYEVALAAFEAASEWVSDMLPGWGQMCNAIRWSQQHPHFDRDIFQRNLSFMQRVFDEVMRG